jgi:halimadienyl-diphosphate synthase
LIRQLGTSQISGSAYDTAWVARLIKMDETIGAKALAWLRENQMPNGCWGAEDVIYNHDRVVCTLAAMIALALWGNAADKKRIKRARLGLDTAIKCLHSDISGATVGFEMIAPLLLDRAFELGAIQRRSDKYLASAYPLQQNYEEDLENAQRREDIVVEQLRRGKAKKLASLPNGMINRFVTTAFSAELAGKDGHHLLDIGNLPENNGSVGCSPSATAYFALQVRPGDLSALTYLRDVANKNLFNQVGVPVVTPFEIFETTWALWNLTLLENLDDELAQLLIPHLDFLEASWQKERGFGFSAEYTPSDGDDTGMGYDVLTHFGRDVDIDAVFHYRRDNHFCCYSIESDSSVSANIHILGALRKAGYKPHSQYVQNIIEFLMKEQLLGKFWCDKWHASPYYPTSHFIINGAGYISNNLIEDSVDWILNTQRPNGAWGYYLSTAEETASCLQALLIWKRNGGTLSSDSLKRGLDWLIDNFDSFYPPLWICKCLYTPKLIVRSSVLSAILLAEEML